METGAFSGSRGRVAASLRFDAEGGPNPSLNIEEGTTNGPPTQRTVSKTLALQVGQTYRLLQDLEISGFGNAQWTGLTSGVTPENWTLNIDAAHTSLAFVDVLGDATLVAASGHDYRLAPVPLPAAVWLLSSALGCGFRCIRRL